MTRYLARLVAVGLCAAALSGCAAAQPGHPLILIDEHLDEHVLDDLDVLDRPPEELALPMIEGATMEWLDLVQREFASNPDFGSPAISLDRTTVTLVWFGAQPVRLRELVAAAPEGLGVVVQAAAFRPGELNELVRRSVAEGLVPGVQVAMAAPETDASGIRIGILELPDDWTLPRLGTAFAQALGRSDVPVTVEVSGAVIPISG